MRRGLPFVATSYMKLLMESVIARALHEHPVKISDLVFLGNHPHMMIVAQDAEQCKNFYGYIQSNLTEILKKLLGLRNLRLWEGYAQVSEILDYDKLLERLAYLYSNPAKAHLESAIELYPGINSWEAFQTAERKVDAVVSKKCPWIRRPMIEKLPSLKVSEATDWHIASQLRQKARKFHELTFHPFASVKAFNPSADAEDLESFVQEVTRRVRLNEAEFEEERKKEGRKVIGARKLRVQAINMDYEPTKFSERQAAFMASTNEERIAAVAEFREFCIKCKAAYQAWSRGDYHAAIWPPGAFRPSMPPTMNVFEVER